ncbi:MAG: M42 family peptidase [Acidobacteria bacterium]|nr:MAG: M42 family peptidase [Acidobacteriota bacterium]RLE35159.1 MAG: M42 family peptidase [Acidobacteriota bacterium]
MSKTAIALLKKLTEADAAPGFETEIREIFRDELSDAGDISTDRMGNIFCTRQGTEDGPVVMLDCHLDEVGFMVQLITKEGFVKFVPLGGWWGHVLLSQRLTISTQKGKVVGVTSAPPPHLLSKDAREKVLEVKDMFLDVGASSQEEAMDELGIRPGQPITPHTLFMPMSNPKMLSAKAFDNRCGCGLVIQAMQRMTGIDHPNTIVGVGSVQEEVGVRGAEVSVAAANPDIAIVLEGPPADDLPGSDLETAQGVSGNGVQIRLFDPSTICHPKLAEFIIQTAEENNINHQVAVRHSGGTNALAIQRNGQGVATVVLGVPARYIHTHVGIINIDDYIAALDLLEALLKKLDKAAVDAIYAG